MGRPHSELTGRDCTAGNRAVSNGMASAHPGRQLTAVQHRGGERDAK